MEVEVEEAAEGEESEFVPLPLIGWFPQQVSAYPVTVSLK